MSNPVAFEGKRVRTRNLGRELVDSELVRRGKGLVEAQPNIGVC